MTSTMTALKEVHKYDMFVDYSGSDTEMYEKDRFTHATDNNNPFNNCRWRYIDLC